MTASGKSLAAWVGFALSAAGTLTCTASVCADALWVRQFDARMLRAADAMRAPWATLVFSIWTQLGSFVFGALAALFVAWRLRRGPRRHLGFVLVSVFGTAVVTQLFKWAIRRARPVEFAPLTGAFGYSFPSAHSATSASFFIASALLLAERKYVATWLLLAGTTSIALAVGASRVYLQVHYPTDVLGGWFLGSLIALGAWLKFERRPHGPA